MLGKCETGKVACFHILDAPKGYWTGRCVFLNTDSPTYNKIFFDTCINNDVLLVFRESLEVHYESTSDR